MKPKLLTTLETYDRRQFVHDCIAGATVALVALPLSIAIAIASGAPPAAGLITAVVGGFLVSALGGSRVQIGGPTGAFIVVVYGIVVRHGLAGLQLATLMAGVILVIGGLLRAGRLIQLIPEAVIEGFTIGIAVVIATSQLKDLAGLTTGALPADFVPKIEGLWAARGTADWSSLLLGLATIVGILLVRRFAPQFRARAVVVLVTSALALALPSVATVSQPFRYASARFAHAAPAARFVAAGCRSGAGSHHDRVACGNRIAPFRARRRPDDRRLAPDERRAARAGRGQHRLAVVRRPARDGRHRPHRDQCRRRRAHPSRRAWFTRC